MFAGAVAGSKLDTDFGSIKMTYINGKCYLCLYKSGVGKSFKRNLRKISDFWWTTRFIPIYIVARHKH